MPIQYINVPENDFGRGIDARSTENQIGEGFVRDLLNADVIQKSVRKRTGYQSYAGNVPVRVTRMEYDYNVNPALRTMCFTLDSVVSLNTSISLESVRSSPLIVYGRSSNQASGPINTAGNNARYYDRFTVPIRKELFAGTNTLLIPGTEHGLGSTNFFCNVVESDSLETKDYSDIYTNSIRIDKANYDVNVDYTVYQDTNSIVYYLNKVSTAGDVYTTTWAHPGGTATLSIPTSTHNLTNYNITYKIYQDTGTEWAQVEENEFILSENGDVSITVTSYSATTYRIILSAAPILNVKEGQISPEVSEQTVTISNLSHPWIFYNIYIKKPASTDYERVEANAVQYSSGANELTLSFDTYSAQSYKIFYEYGDIRSNVLCVYDTTVPNVAYPNNVDFFPQITLWGLDHDEIYTDKSAREGWTTHIDTYRRSAEQRVICGLGGNLFSAQEYSEAASQYLYPTLYPSLYSRTSAALSVGPVFYDTGDTPGRTRGYITTSTGGVGWVAVTRVEYDAGNGWTKYTLSVPNMNIVGTLTTIISSASGVEDWLTVNNMPYKKHEGTFRIKQVASGADQLEIWVENAQNNSSDWDDTNVGGYAGVFTDQVTWTVPPSYIPQDTLLLTGETLATVYSSDTTVTVCGPFETSIRLAAGVLITGRRTSSVIPLRQGLPSLADSVQNLVKGDVLSYTGINRLLRVVSINPGVDQAAFIAPPVDNVATVTITDTTYLATGMRIVLIGAGLYSGVQTISNILSQTEFTFETTVSEASTITAILSGKTIEIDESLTWQDTSGDQTAFQVARRWIPIEAPTDNFNMTPSTYVRHFDSAEYSAQPFIRSTMVADNLYLTNGSDEVMKFDGQNIYRAGLPAWQPGLFATLDTAATAKIVTGLRQIAVVGSATISAAEGRIEIGAGKVNTIPIGSVVKIDNLSGTYTVRNYETDGTKHYILFDRALASAPAAPLTIYETAVYKYYFRLNAVDANDNIIASAMTSSDDMSVQMIGDAAIQLKLVGMPALDNYDYDRIEVEIYRTKLLTGQVAPVFYKVVTLGSTSSPSHNFNITTGYLEYTDTAADSDLTQVDLLSSVAGAELGIGWSDPLRAKYITTTNNRLVLGNVRDYPEFDIQIDGAANLTSGVFAGDSLLFRRELTDTGTTTDMTSRVRFEWKAGFTGTASTFNVGTDEFSFVTSTATGAVPGDWIYLTYDTVATSGRDLKYSGWWQIKAAVGTTVTVNLVGASAVTNYPNRYVIATDPTDVPVYLGTDGNLGQLNGDVLNNTSETFDATRRMALAVNAVMRMTDTSLNGYSAFRPWLIARSGNDVTRAGRIVVRVPQQSDILPSVVPTFGGYSLFVNSIAATSSPLARSCTYTINSTIVTAASTAGLVVGAQVSDGIVYVPNNTIITEITNATTFKISNVAITSGSSTTQFSIPIEASEKIYPSRILVSYQNYPELFDNPTAILDSDSLSAIDINSADGQEITGVIPFFGEAAFTAAQQAGILVVFKTNSIYLVDINQKVSGSNLIVQRLETQGIGCTAPYSISVTKNGVMFANNSGIYRLRRDQAIEYIGKFMERNWLDKVDRDVLGLAQGHHYAVGRMYKLSVPIVGTQNTATGYMEPSQVYVYNHTQEEEGQLGAWSRYDSHTAIGWANLASDAFWASTGGKVYILRTTGSETDFRDSNEAIVFRLDTRPNDYGNSGIRKVLDKVIANYRTGAATASNMLYFAVDLEREYSATTPFRVAGTEENLNGVDDLVQKDIVTLRHSLDRRKGVFFSVRIENSNLDQNVEVAGIDYRIGGLDSKGIKSASKT